MAQVRPLDPSQEPPWPVAGTPEAGDRAGHALVGGTTEERSPGRDVAARAPERAATLVDVFSATVARHPDQVALEGGGTRLTYLELAGCAGQLARRLAAAGVRRGDRVGVRVPSGSTDLHVAILGTLMAGAAYVPVDAADPEDRAQAIWRDAAVDVVVTVGLDIAPVASRRPASDRTTGLGAPVELPQASAAPSPTPACPEPEDACWIIFTSGSTGAPKGVLVTHRSAAAFVHAESQLFDVTPADRVLAGLSVASDASCEEMWLAWRHGAALVACPREVVQSGVDLGPWLVEHRITVVSTVPTLAAMWDDSVLADVRLLVLGGEACSDQLGWRLAAGRTVWNTYGPTEATVVTTAARITAGAPVTIGRPLAGWDVAVVDHSGQQVERGAVGELVVGGIGLGRYLDPELDASRFAPLPALGWSRAYRTGDLVRWTPSGLQFLGRRDDQVKIGGRRIELGEIEAALARAPRSGGRCRRHPDHS